MRLNKLLASRLNISRRKADELISSNRVTVGENTAVLGMEIKNPKAVKIKGKELSKESKNIYLLLNKPVDYICSRQGQGSKTIYELLPPDLKHLNTVGRLDKDTSGLLLLTNDGDLHNKLTHPKFQKNKIYQVNLNKNLTQNDQNLIGAGKVVLKDGVSRFNINQQNIGLEVTLKEGKNRQIRRTFNALGYKVAGLHRICFGNYKLKNLESGQYKIVSKYV